VAEQTNRADRILDAAGKLLLRFGYRKVTIEDISRQAGIGKGTVYLHWRTKQELFEALLRRESIALVEEIVTRMRADPAEARPHRIARTTFLLCHREPLMMAIMTGDAELLGQLKESPLAGQDLVSAEEYFEIITRHGLVRTDVPDLFYAWEATTNGFYLLDSISPAFTSLDAETKADALARTLRAAFEPAEEPSEEALTAAAAELSTIFANIASSYRKWIYYDEKG